MNDKIPPFDFSEAYRSLQPNAERELVTVREASHSEILKQINLAPHVLDLCRLAFGLAIASDSALGSLMLAEVRKGDVQFSLSKDRAEAGRIASLILASRLADGLTQDAIAILATSFAGQRASADESRLVSLSLACLAKGTRARKTIQTNPNVAYPKLADRAALITAVEQAMSAQTMKPLLDALIADDRAGGESLAKSVTTVLQSLFQENQRLAEEVDLLWWHISDWSECLGRPIGQVPENGRGLIASADLAQVIRILPGPYGATGILRRSLGPDPDRSMSLREAVEALAPDELKHAYQNCTDTDVLPVHTAIQLYLDRGNGAWKPAFEKACGTSCDAPLSPYKIALQAFWECCLIKQRWAK